MNKSLIIIASLIVIMCAFLGYKIWADISAQFDSEPQKEPHLTIITPDPIVATSWFKVSAVAPEDIKRDAVPFIRIMRKSDGAYMGGKALKVAFNAEYSVLAPSTSGDYLLQLDGIEEEFTVHPIVAKLSLENEVVIPGETLHLNLETNTNGHQSLTLENSRREKIKTIRHGADQNFLSGKISIMAPVDVGAYTLVYRNALDEEVASISFLVMAP